MAQWQSLPGILDPIPINKFLGVNRLDPFSIPEGAATSLKNFTSSAFPTLTVRPGFSNLGVAFGGAIVGLGVWKDTELHAVGGGTWNKWTGSAWSAVLASSLSTTAQWSFCNFKGSFSGINLLGVNGAVAKKYDGSTVSALANCPAGANYIDTHDNRVYVAVDFTLYYSALRKAEDWTTVKDSGSIVVETPDGENISGIKAGPKHLVVFKPQNMFKLYGTSYLDFELVQVSDKIGCVAGNTPIMVGNYLYFLGHDGIYRYAAGLPEKDFSLPIDWYVQNINMTYRSKACSGTDGRRLYMFLPIGTATEPSHGLEYDPVFNTWYVWELPHYPRSFAYFNEDWYGGDSAGQVHLMGGSDDAGTAISWEWISKPFGEDKLVRIKRWLKLWAEVEIPTGSTFNVYLSKEKDGNSDWTAVTYNTVDKRVIIPTDVVALANYVRIKLSGTGPVNIYEINRRLRELPL